MRNEYSSSAQKRQKLSSTLLLHISSRLGLADALAFGSPERQSVQARQVSEPAQRRGLVRRGRVKTSSHRHHQSIYGDVWYRSASARGLSKGIGRPRPSRILRMAPVAGCPYSCESGHFSGSTRGIERRHRIDDFLSSHFGSFNRS
jgi:hypothetical protein